MRSTYIGACAGVVIFGVSLGGFAQPPEGKGKPADAGRPAVAQFPIPQHSVGVMHGASVIQSQRPAPPPPSMTAPASASGGIGHAFGNGNANATSAGQAGNLPGSVSSVGQIAKTPGNAIAIAEIEKVPTDEKERGNGSPYSLQAVLPVAPGGFPAIQKSVPVPECFAR